MGFDDAMRTDGREGLVGHLIKGGIFSVVRGILLCYTLVTVIVFIHNFTIYYSQERTLIEEARERYEYACVDQDDVRKARLFFHTCTSDRITKDKCAEWEAFARVVRKQQLCGEGEDCGKVAYVLIGMFLGVVGLIFIMPKLQCMFEKKIDDMNTDHMYSFATSSSK